MNRNTVVNPVVMVFAALAVVIGVVPAAAQQAPERSIVEIAPDLYRVQNDNHYTVYLVTPAGVIMSDPINRDFATWLKDEIQSRHNQTVRYVLYSHRDWDHASGGAVFADTAEFIGHVNMPRALAVPAGEPPLPANAVGQDANGNGRLERSEAAGNLSNNFDLYDADSDGALTGAEIARGPLGEVHPPTMTYSDRHTVTLGGKTVHMIHTGPAHADDSTVLHFPAERVVFAADTLQVRRLPLGVPPTIGAWINAIRTIEELDFDIAAPGHALMGRKEDVTALRQYLEDLATGVAAGIAAGRSLPEIQQTLTLDRYRDWERFEAQRPAHIAQVYATIKGAP